MVTPLTSLNFKGSTVELNVVTVDQKCLTIEQNRLVFRSCQQNPSQSFDFDSAFVGEIHPNKNSSMCLHIKQTDEIIVENLASCSKFIIYKDHVYFKEGEITYTLAERKDGAAIFSPYEEDSVLFKKSTFTQR